MKAFALALIALSLTGCATQPQLAPNEVSTVVLESSDYKGLDTVRMDCYLKLANKRLTAYEVKFSRFLPPSFGSNVKRAVYQCIEVPANKLEEYTTLDSYRRQMQKEDMSIEEFAAYKAKADKELAHAQYLADVAEKEYIKQMNADGKTITITHSYGDAIETNTYAPDGSTCKTTVTTDRGETVCD